VTRCEWSDLPVDQCGHCTGAPEISEGPKPTRQEGSQTEARFPGSCGHCDERFQVGAEIVMADVDGNGASDEWCLLDHTVALTTVPPRLGGGW